MATPELKCKLVLTYLVKQGNVVKPKSRPISVEFKTVTRERFNKLRPKAMLGIVGGKKSKIKIHRVTTFKKAHFPFDDGNGVQQGGTLALKVEGSVGNNVAPRTIKHTFVADDDHPGVDNLKGTPKWRYIVCQGKSGVFYLLTTKPGPADNPPTCQDCANNPMALSDEQYGMCLRNACLGGTNVTADRISRDVG